jgi:hypothetical protein
MLVEDRQALWYRGPGPILTIASPAEVLQVPRDAQGWQGIHQHHQQRQASTWAFWRGEKWRGTGRGPGHSRLATQHHWALWVIGWEKSDSTTSSEATPTLGTLNTLGSPLPGDIAEGMRLFVIPVKNHVEAEPQKCVSQWV